MLLDGLVVEADVLGAITQADVERTMEGASTFNLTLFDKQRALLRSDIFKQAVEMILGGLNFRLVKVGKKGDSLELVAEDRAVASMRKYRAFRKAYRDTMTRAEFVLSLVREAKEEPDLIFYCPELHTEQDVAGGPSPSGSSGPEPSQQDSNRPGAAREVAEAAGEERRPGFAPGARVTVKGAAAQANQRETIEAVLNEGIKHRVDFYVLVALIMVITQEHSATNASGGDRDSTGAFQQRGGSGWRGNLLSIPNQVNNFLFNAPTEPFIRVYKRSYGNRTLGWMISQTQRDYTFGGSGQGRDFQQWREEAERTVKTFLGGTDVPAGPGGSTPTDSGRYEFTRGQIGSPEDTWTCLGRLAEEVAWRRFLVGRYLYFIGEEDLMRSKPRATLSEASQGVDWIDFDHDIGKDTAEATITARVDLWAAPPGSVVELVDVGVADGLWLVSTIRRNLFSADCTITLKKPRPELPEPAAESSGAGATVKAPGATTDGRFGDPLKSMKPITGEFGENRGDHTHSGLDIGAASGTSVYAVGDGRITSAGSAGGYGNRIVVDHGGGIQSTYNHLSAFKRTGGQVRQGEHIGSVGSTGNSTGAHLHFEIVKNGSPVNPRPYIPGA